VFRLGGLRGEGLTGLVCWLLVFHLVHLGRSFSGRGGGGGRGEGGREADGKVRERREADVKVLDGYIFFEARKNAAVRERRSS
jgi:hypothetical protein